jgi:hypothetical protein
MVGIINVLKGLTCIIVGANWMQTLFANGLMNKLLGRLLIEDLGLRNERTLDSRH